MRFSALLIAFAVLAGAVAAEERPREIIVTGEGVVAGEPDMAVVTIGVSRDARLAGEAMAATSEAAAEVLKTVSEAGVEARDVQTSSVSLSPIWDRQKRDSPPRVAGYEASNTLSVRVRDLSRLGRLLDSVIGSGANQMHGLDFTLSDPRPAQDQARAAAVRDARAKAETLATAAGIELGPVRSSSEGGGGYSSGSMMQREAMIASEVPIATGEVETRVTVTMIFDIGG